jgi:hypothetical protein
VDAGRVVGFVARVGSAAVDGAEVVPVVDPVWIDPPAVGVGVVTGVVVVAGGVGELVVDGGSLGALPVAPGHVSWVTQVLTSWSLLTGIGTLETSVEPLPPSSLTTLAHWLD